MIVEGYEDGTPVPYELTRRKRYSKVYQGPKRARSKVWNYFTRSETDPTTSKCNECSGNIKLSDGSTGQLIKHLLKIHDIDIKNLPDQAHESEETENGDHNTVIID